MGSVTCIFRPSESEMRICQRANRLPQTATVMLMVDVGENSDKITINVFEYIQTSHNRMVV